jgi:heat shock protein HslJ
MLFKALALLSLFLGATPVAPTTPPSTGSSVIPPVKWELVELTGEDGKPVAVAEPGRYMVQFRPEGELAVVADCNQVAGTYEATDGDLVVTLTVSTLVLCPPDSWAEPFQTLLENATAFMVDQDGFLILRGDASSLRLRATVQGVRWEWRDFRGGNDEIVTPKNPEDYTTAFLPDGTMAIEADCNRAMGTYAIDGPRIDIRVGGVTRMQCPEGSLMERFLRDLDEASSSVFSDGDLYLSLPLDAGIMAFEARVIETPAATPKAG